jgi:epoxyqueuosine reductase QueG
MAGNDELKSFVHSLGIDLVGVADLQGLEGMPVGLPMETAGFLQDFPRAIVLGVQHGKLGERKSGREISRFLEGTALSVVDFLSDRGWDSLVLRCDEEFDLVNRYGLLSLKVLAKAAGLGWQGRSLLIVSPEYGPVHRCVAILTNMDLQPDQPIPNQCKGDEGCKVCLLACPWMGNPHL